MMSWALLTVCVAMMLVCLGGLCVGMFVRRSRS